MMTEAGMGMHLCERPARETQAKTKQGDTMKKRGMLRASSWVVLMLLIVGVSLLGIAPRDTNAASQAKKLQVGMIACLTGFFAVHDVPDAEEVQFAAQMINERGGIKVKGEKYDVEIVIEDGKSTLDGITAAANRLVFDKGLKLLIGPAGFFAGASSPVTTPNKVLNIISYCTNQPGEMDKSTPYTFMAFDGSAGSFFAAITYINKNYPEVKKVAVLIPDDGSAPYLAPIYKKAIAGAGMTWVGDLVTHPNEIQDFSPIAAKVNGIKDWDALIIGNAIPQNAAALIKGLRELGNKKLVVLASINPMHAVVKIAGPEACKNVVVNGVVPNDPSNPPLMNELSKRIVAKHGPDATMYVQGANSLWVLKQVIEKAQSIDATAIKTTWESMDTAETFFGQGKMCGDQTHGIKHHLVAHPAPYEILKDGKVASGGWSGAVFVP